MKRTRIAAVLGLLFVVLSLVASAAPPNVTKWKYIRYFSKENDREQYLPDASIEGEKPVYEELFDLEADPNEQNNLADNPEYASVLNAHRVRCQDLVTELARN